MEPNSPWRWSRALAILSLHSARTSSWITRTPSLVDHGADRLADQHTVDVPGLEDVEDHDRQLVVAAEGDGRRVHDLEALVDHVDVGDPVVALGLGVGAGVGGVHAVDAGVRALEDHPGPDLRRPQR